METIRMKIKPNGARFALFLLLCSLLPSAQASVLKQLPLEPVGHIAFELIDESSALVKSPSYPNTFWTLNDSGDLPRIFAINATGELIAPAWDKAYQGLMLEGAANIDWEDLAFDDLGNLLVAACGNNGNARQDLGVYLLAEPNPLAVNAAYVQKRLSFRYPDQKSYPPRSRNFDCEAIFFADGHLHFMTKHRADSKTRLYRMDAEVDRFSEGAQSVSSANKCDEAWYLAFREDKPTVLTYLGEMDLGRPASEGRSDGQQGMVTAADWDPLHRRLVFMNYRAIWMIDRVDADAKEGNLLAGRVRWLPMDARQSEAICFDGDTLCITNEQRDVFRVSVNALLPLQSLLLH
jgi:hypothetical protein